MGSRGRGKTPKNRKGRECWPWWTSKWPVVHCHPKCGTFRKPVWRSLFGEQLGKAEGFGVPTQTQVSSFCSWSALVTQDMAWSKGMGASFRGLLLRHPAPGLDISTRAGGSLELQILLSEAALDPRWDRDRDRKISPNISNSELWTLLASRNPLHGCNFSPVKILLWQKMWEGLQPVLCPTLQPNATVKIYHRDLSGNVTERFHLQDSGHDTSLSRENTSHVLLCTQTSCQKMAPLWLESQGLTWLEGCKCS